jgi:hypothetical protein
MMEDSNFATGYAVGRDSNGGYGNNGIFGNDWAWIVILLLFGYGGRGFGGFGGFGGGFGGGCGAPCATQADVRSAVDQQTLISKLDQQTYGLADSTYALNNTITNGFHGVDNAICNLGYNVQSGFNTLGHQLADCCCSTQRAIDSVKYENATNTCAIQNTIQNTTRDVIENANANSRAILDFLVQDKLASKDARIAQLENKLSQSEQNAFISATIDASQATLIRRLGADCPTPAYVVQPPQPVTFPTNCCGQAQLGGCNGGF